MLQEGATGQKEKEREREKEKEKEKEKKRLYEYYFMNLQRSGLEKLQILSNTICIFTSYKLYLYH
jgi:hypothetical protein